MGTMGTIFGSITFPSVGVTITPTPDVTAKIRIRYDVQQSAEVKEQGKILLGLFGKEAPVACSIFYALAEGTLSAPCRDPSDASDSQALQRETLVKRGVQRQCLADEAKPVSYSGSSVWRIIKGQRIDFGSVQGKFASRQAPSTPITESNGLSHDRPGLLSVPRGGGVFDFTITLASLPELDSTNIVIGEVLGDRAALDYLSDLPVVQYYGQGQGSETSRSKQCYYGSGDTFCSQLKPLKKVSISTFVM